MPSRTVDRQRGGARWIAVCLLTLFTTALYGAIRFSQALPEGPQEVAWDLEACAHCHMHVGDPSFAAQLQTAQGDVLNFDDPGCLLRFEAERHPTVHAIYFHAQGENRWIPRAAVAFVPVSQTPMGYGLGAVAAGTPVSGGPAPLTYEAARAQTVSRPQAGQGE